MDMLYSTHLLQPLKCSPANTACLQEWNQGKGLVGMTEKPMDLRSNCDFFKNWAKIALYQSNSGKLKIIDSGF